MIFNSLKFKIAGIVAVMVIIIISITSSHNYIHRKTILLKVAEQSSGIIVENILANIHNAMKSGHTSDVNEILARITSSDNIKTLRVVDDDGQILRSTNTNETGQFLPPEKLNFSTAHTRKKFIFFNRNDNFTVYSQIPNASECRGCHAASKPYIAVLETELYLQNFSKYVNSELSDTILSAITVTILIIGVLFLVLVFYVDRPVKQTVKSIQDVESGNFTVTTPVTSSNEISLSRKTPT